MAAVASEEGASSHTCGEAGHEAAAPLTEQMHPTKHLPYQGAGPAPLPPEPVSALSAATSLPKTSASAGRSSSRWDRETVAAQRLLGSASASEAPLHLRCLPSLTWEERIMGFVGCFAIGFTLSLTSIFSFPQLLLGDPSPFAWKYSVGNVLGLASSTFLVGPQAQLEQMASPVRIGATIAYLASIVVTVVAALVLRHALITLCTMLFQFVALGWYCASYIPFGRWMIQQCVGRVCCPV